jgi:hypothetical protein
MYVQSEELLGSTNDTTCIYFLVQLKYKYPMINANTT